MTGQIISHYRVIEQIGAGGMGVVYRAEDIRLGRALVLKFLPMALSRDPMALERFEREAKAASSINHPGICTVYDIGEFEGQRFIAMEYLDGQPLDRYIGGRPLALTTLLDLGIQVADALELAHGQGILHRDIKPANIFVTRRGHAKVLDFGLAKLAAGGSGAVAVDAAAQTVAAQLLTTVGLAVGTVAYMSPEQARGEGLDARSDLFSLGVVLHEMATGRQAFSGPTAAVVFDAILNRMPPPIVSVNPEVPLELERIVDKAIEKDRQLRYQGAADLKSDLLRLKRDRESGRVSIAGLSQPRSGEHAAALPASGVTSSATAASSETVAVPIPSGASAPPSGASAPAVTPAVAPASASIPAAPSVPEVPVAAAPAAAKVPAAKRSNTRALAAIGIAALVLAGVGAAFVWNRQRAVSAEPASQAAVPDQAPVPEPPPSPPVSVAEALPPVTEAVPPEGDEPPPPAAPAPTAAAPKRGSKPASSRRSTPEPAAPIAATPLPAAPTVAPAAERDPVADAVAAAQPAIDQGRFDEALSELQGALGRRPTSQHSAQAKLLIARIYDRQKRVDAALAAYADLRATHPQDPVSAEALLRMADLVQQTKQSDRTRTARTYLDQIIANFPTSTVAPRALTQRAIIEEREDLKVTDPVLKRAVPAALVTYRQLTEAYPQTPTAEGAYVRLAKYYDDLKRYDLQAQALTSLGSYFPANRHDAWWEAGEVYEKRLRDTAKAKEAYAKVPQTSRRYRDAQKKVSEL